MKIYTLHEILLTAHIGDEKYVRYEEIERLGAALDKYGKHESGCRYYYAENKCTCGLQQALKEE